MTNDTASAPKTTWTSFLSQIYLSGRRPVNGSYDYRAIEEKAREVTKDNRGTCQPSPIALRTKRIAVISRLHVHIWQCRDEQHVSEQLGGTRAMAYHPSYASQRHRP